MVKIDPDSPAAALLDKRYEITTRIQHATKAYHSSISSSFSHKAIVEEQTRKLDAIDQQLKSMLGAEWDDGRDLKDRRDVSQREPAEKMAEVEDQGYW